MIHIAVWQKPTQHCKASILQFKKFLNKIRSETNKKKKKCVLKVLMGPNNKFLLGL